MRIVPFTYYPGYQEDPAISPDSKEIAFVGQGKDGNRPFEVYVQLIGSTDPLRLTSVSADSADRSPVWDPSSTRIAFLRTRRGERFARILTIAALGAPKPIWAFHRFSLPDGWRGARMVGFSRLPAPRNE